MEANLDGEELGRYYRRIEALFRQLEVSLLWTKLSYLIAEPMTRPTQI